MRLSAQAHRSVYVIHNTPPDGYLYVPGAINIGAFYWETDAIPYLRGWIELIQMMDHMWAKSTHNLAFLRRCGLVGDIPIVTWPIDFESGDGADPRALERLDFHYLERLDGDPPVAGAGLPSILSGLDPPIFLSISSLAPRKGLPVLLSEWRDHVGGGGRGLLVLKLRAIHNERLAGGNGLQMEHLLREVGYRPGDPVQIAYSFQDVSNAQIRALYALSDAYVTATYGEGFCGPVVEALAAGKPVIAPRHTSLVDLLPEDYPLLVDSRRRVVGLAGNPSIYPHGSSWHIPVRGELRRAFQRFVEMMPSSRAEAARHAGRHARAFCDKGMVAATLKRVFEGLDGGAGDWT